MPRVSKVDLKYDSKWGKTHDIWYTQKAKFEIRDLPSELLSLTELRPTRYATEEALIKDAKAACRKYRELKKTERKVILYKCLASSHLTMNCVKFGSHYQGRLPGVSKKIRGFNSGNGIPLATVGISYMICKVIDDGADPEYYKINPETGEIKGYKFKNPRSYQEMEYTEERHQFFIQVTESMKRMVKEMSKFFGAEPEKAIKLIENNKKLLGQ